MCKPWLTTSNTYSNVQSQPGFFGAGGADEGVEAAFGEDAIDGVFDARLGAQGFPGGEDAKLVFGVAFEGVFGVVDLHFHVEVVGRIGDGGFEGEAAGSEAAGSGTSGLVTGTPVLRQGFGRCGGYTVVDEVGEDASGTAILDFFEIERFFRHGSPFLDC
jgi:hypothetical protein